MRCIFILVFAAAMTACHRTPIAYVVVSEEQALALVHVYEHNHLREIYGRDDYLPPLASKEPPYSVIETKDSYSFEFRKPFMPFGGGYIKGFAVSKHSGEVTRSVWMLGR